jgi:hypothetical protein
MINWLDERSFPSLILTTPAWRGNGNDGMDSWYDSVLTGLENLKIVILV